jgi:hypothetical protein
MKKLSILSIVAVAAISLASCKKDRVCECSVGGSVDKVTYNDATKRQGKANCVSYTEENFNGTSTKVECKLKK